MWSQPTGDVTESCTESRRSGIHMLVVETIGRCSYVSQPVPRSAVILLALLPVPNLILQPEVVLAASQPVSCRYRFHCYCGYPGVLPPADRQHLFQLFLIGAHAQLVFDPAVP